MDTRNVRYNLYGAVAVLLWSSSIPVFRGLSERIGMFRGAGLTYLAAAVISALALYVRRRRDPDAPLGFSFRQLAFCGPFFVLYMIALYMAVGMAAGHRQVIEVSLLNYLWPMFTLLFAVPIHRKKINLWLFPLGAALALAGIFWANKDLNGSDFSLESMLANIRGHFAPYALALAAAVLWALYSNVSRFFATTSSLPTLSVLLPITGAALFGLGAFFPQAPAAWNGRCLIELAALAALPGFLAYVLWDAAVRRGDIVFVAAFSCLAPLFSVVFIALYLRVPIGWGVAAACLMVVSGAALCKISVREAKR